MAAKWFRALSVFFLFLNPTAYAEEENTFQPPEFPKAIADDIFIKSFIERKYFDYDQLPPVEFGDVEKGRLAWNAKEIDNKIEVTTLHFTFRNTDPNAEEPTEFVVTLKFPLYNVHVIHSRPRYKGYAGGIVKKYSENLSSPWGAFIHGKDVPGILFLIGRADAYGRAPVLLCPRGGSPTRKNFFLKSASAELVKVVGVVEGSTLVSFSSGYGKGSAEVKYSPMRVPSSIPARKYLVMQDPYLDFRYGEGVFHGEGLVDPSGVTPIGMTSEVELVNGASYRKKAQSSKIVWIEERQVDGQKPFIIHQHGYAKKINIHRGLCVQVLPFEHTAIQYESPEIEEEEEQKKTSTMIPD